MPSYKDYLEELADTKKPDIFYNSGPDHAIEVFTTLYEHGKDTARILCGDLNGKISGSRSYQNALSDFFFRNGKIKIAIDRYDPKSEPPLFSLLRFFALIDSERVEVKQCSPIKLKDKDLHYCVVDDMYRMETDTIEYKAYGSFNDSKMAEILRTNFDYKFKVAQTIPLLTQ